MLFARDCRFLMGAVQVAQLPPGDLPEVAFAGRSNVGKSSLINGLTGRLHLARASNEPGRTRELNLFLLDARLRLIDLPGYGWARVERRVAAKFQNLGRQYLRGRASLKRAYLLIDARHGLKDPDGEAMDALDLAAVSYQVVLTKADKLRSDVAVAEVQARTEAALKKRPAAFPRVAVTSAETGRGLPELRAEIAAVCALF